MTRPFPQIPRAPLTPAGRGAVSGAWQATVLAHTGTGTGTGYTVSIHVLAGVGVYSGVQAIGTFTAGAKVWVTPIEGDRERWLILGART